MTHNQTTTAPASCKSMSKEDREKAFKRLWVATHRDYRGRLADGSRSVLSYARYGGGLVTAESISESELIERVAALGKCSA